MELISDHKLQKLANGFEFFREKIGCFFYRYKFRLIKEVCELYLTFFLLDQKVKTNPIPPGVLSSLSAPRRRLNASINTADEK